MREQLTDDEGVLDSVGLDYLVPLAQDLAPHEDLDRVMMEDNEHDCQSRLGHRHDEEAQD